MAFAVGTSNNLETTNEKMKEDISRAIPKVMFMGPKTRVKPKVNVALRIPMMSDLIAKYNL